MSSINSWLRCNGTGKLRDPQVLGVIPHDMYVIGTQESALTEKDWVNFVKNHIKSCLRADVEMVKGDNSNWQRIFSFFFIILERNNLKLKICECMWWKFGLKSTHKFYFIFLEVNLILFNCAWLKLGLRKFLIEKSFLKHKFCFGNVRWRCVHCGEFG